MFSRDPEVSSSVVVCSMTVLVLDMRLVLGVTVRGEECSGPRE